MLKLAQLLAISVSWAFLISASCFAQARLDFSSAPLSGRFSLPTWSPSSVDEFLLGRQIKEYQKPAFATAYLKFPINTSAASSDKLPAVVLMHGVGGLQSDRHLEYWPKALNDAGYAVLIIDSFTERGITELINNPNGLTSYASVADVFSGLEALSTHPRINANKIAVMGFSRGGGVAWLSAIEQFAKANLPDGLRFAAHIPIYAQGCASPLRVRPTSSTFKPNPMLWIHGSADNWTSAKACQDYSTAINEITSKSEFLLLDGAHHSFDAASLIRAFSPTALEVERCPLEYNLEEKKYFDRFGNKVLTDNEASTFLMSCVGFGMAITQGDRDATNKAIQAIRTFLNKSLRQP